MIKILDQATINKIAAGEVVDRPSSVVKELVENAIDAGANAITVEIKDGGISFIRITDNGSGIEMNEVPTAFIRHATSKIVTIEDLLSVSFLGFRGEALASIAAVAQVECITKTAPSITGIRYEIHGSTEIAREEIGAPIGTTIVIRNLFYNVPARKKFLKTAMTEGSYVTELLIRLALSHPEISFKYIMNGSNKISTSGNGNLKDVIYHIYGKEIASNLLEIKKETDEFKIEGYIGKAYVSKGNRSFEHYFVNGRLIRSNVVTKAIEEGYKSFVMVHKFPFTAFHLYLNSDKLDVNVHPQKMEFKYTDGEALFQFVKDNVREALLSEEMIQEVSLKTKKEEKDIRMEEIKVQTQHIPEPFEKNASSIRRDSENVFIDLKHEKQTEIKPTEIKPTEIKQTEIKPTEIKPTEIKQMEMFEEEQFISAEGRKKHRLIGQVFKTYWLIEYDEKMYIIDQHAAHEKVMFERLMKQVRNKKILSQQILPPKILHLDSIGHTTVLDNIALFEQCGFELEDFGDESIVLRAVPDDIMGINPDFLFDELTNSLTQDTGTISTDIFVEKVSQMACKAAIKGNTIISSAEADALIDEMLKLDNPYNCPHGRPTMIAMSQYELERKFKRIQDK